MSDTPMSVAAVVNATNLPSSEIEGPSELSEPGVVVPLLTLAMTVLLPERT